ncbi:MAG: hypothetical protein PHX60_06600 [Giesbergeria sp.]|uniref:hypothetical protein n=1 Tax=Giesbergeria sp. TaxID=2818473 RepID=UPI00260DC17F|nr:hypothetical protein [Giesbergeria sp.]MDD2609353.1 hypothetical protein [Giesbergeria sp.]
MKKFDKYLLKLSLLIGLSAFGSAHAEFTSLHQLPKVYKLSLPLIGFKDQFAPSGIPGCVMGYPELRSRCATVEGGFGFILKGYTSFNEFKVYIPASTTFFGLSGYLPQGEKYAVVARMGTTPDRTTSLTLDEYEKVKRTQNINTDFYRLQAGEEMIFVHDGGGNISLSGTARLTKNPVQTGKWLYVRVLNGGSIYNLTSVYEVNLDQYRTAYNTLNFGTDGDPVDRGTAPTVPVLPGVAQIKDNVPTTNSNGNLVLNFTLKRPATETEGTNRTSFWIAAYVPAGFLPEEAWFFLTPGGWQQLTSTNPYTVAYQNSQAAQPEKIFNISTGLSAADLRHFNAQLHFGYMGNDGQLKDMGVIWSGN